MSTQDTIAAIASAPGKGGIGIVRISGPAVPMIMQRLFAEQLKPRFAEYKPFLDTHGQIIDRGIVIYFVAPHSYTGEDVLELQGHGGPVVLNLLLKQILAYGVRQARPGEFTERAFLNEKLDLIQAEAVIDLIESSSEQAAKAAAQSLEGVFSEVLRALLQKLIELRMYIEAALDFPEEEIDFLSDNEIQLRMDGLVKALDAIRQRVKQGRLLKDGMSVVILGQPNAGKSSLLNQLAGRDTAIVTEIAGTTRDVLREHIHIDGIPLHIIDTAGLRDTQDVVEKEGVRRAWLAANQADRILLLVDARTGISEYETTVLQQIPPHLPVDIIYNKIDLLSSPVDLAVISHARGAVILLSAKTGTGLENLIEHLKQSIGIEQTSESLFSARQRHVDALNVVNERVANAQECLNLGQGELAAEELRMAQLVMSSITGEFSSDDLLGEIFSRFCIGK
ncbi:MAG: tRNA uridine-5-carboxymethylaminomethyl(34) synthesis GTPase MnmE [Gammaproteobacteria bacterium]|nr:tRNA uridine-5-carboxymethylaminomethyl(34) synthesis GTPase MnmE [Gammaproteobacteria bacterium]